MRALICGNSATSAENYRRAHNRNADGCRGVPAGACVERVMLALLTLASYAYAVTFLAAAVLLAMHLDSVLRLIWSAGADAPSGTGPFRLGNGPPVPPAQMDGTPASADATLSYG
jgi:hypothetical protein